MTKEQEPNYLKMAVDSMVDDEVEGPRVILGPTALKNLVNRVRNAALDEVAHKLPHIISTWRITGGPPTVSGERHVIDAIRNLKEPTP